MTKSTLILATSIAGFFVLVGCGSLAEESLMGQGADGGAGGGIGPFTDGGGGGGQDSGSALFDSGAASDSGGGNEDGGTAADAGMTDGGPGFDAAHGPACLDTLDCAYGEVCRGGRCGKPSWDGGTAYDAGMADGGTTMDGGGGCANQCPGSLADQSVCDGSGSRRTCEWSPTEGCFAWSDPTACGAGAGCSGGSCVACDVSLLQEGESCGGAKPCDCGLECKGLPGRPEWRACHAGCGYFDRCSPDRTCAGDDTAAQVCMNAASVQGAFSCRLYPEGVTPEPSDPPGIASVRFRLGGTDYSFAYCLGDVERAAGTQASAFTVTLADYTYAAAGVEYRYVMGIAAAQHASGIRPVGAAGPIWADIYQLLTDAGGAIMRIVWVGYAADGLLDLRQIGDGAGVETSGVLMPTVHYEANEVVCDNADPDPARHCP